MSEWLKEHAWKAILAAFTEQHPGIATRKRINGLLPSSARRCDAVFFQVLRGFRARLTQFLHSSRSHLLAYAVVLLRVRRHPLND